MELTGKFSADSERDAGRRIEVHTAENLTVPLKQWPKRARTNNLKSKFHYRKLVACEEAALGEQEFMSTYYPHDVPLVKLESLIRDRNNGNAVENGTASE